MNAEINRDYYLQLLIQSQGNGYVKIITGLRRCGKSYLVFKLFKEYLLQNGVPQKNIIEFPLDQLRNENLRNPLILAQSIRARLGKKGRYFVFIDEIQLCGKVLRDGVDLSRIAPEDRETAFLTFYDVLNEFRSLPNVDLYVTGSNSKTLSSDIATTFRDRGETIQIHPLSFGEISKFRQDTSMKLLKEYLLYGGMPIAVLKETVDEKKKYLKDLFKKVYLKDIIERYRLRNNAVIENLSCLLCSNIGSLTNPAKLVKTLDSVMRIKSSIHTLKSYLDFLEDSFLFRRAERFDIKGKHYLDYPSKYYAEDTGLRNACLNYRQNEQTHLMENAIFNELIRRGYNVDVGVVMREMRENGIHMQKQHEIDFVVNSEKGKVYIQSAFSIDDTQKKKQELLPLRLCGDFFSRVVVTATDDIPWTDDEGFTYVGIVPFLLDDTILSSKMK